MPDFTLPLSAADDDAASGVRSFRDITATPPLSSLQALFQHNFLRGLAVQILHRPGELQKVLRRDEPLTIGDLFGTYDLGTRWSFLQ